MKLDRFSRTKPQVSERSLGALLLLASGCAVHVYSPPSGAPLVESPASLGAQRSSVRADASFGGATFGPDLSTYRATVTHGLKDTLDLSLSPSLIWIHGQGSGDSHPGIYALRAGVKYAPIPHVALTAGLGGGGSAAGGFLSPDVAAIVGFENRYFVPFASVRGLLSVPVTQRTVHIVTDDDASDDYSDADSEPDRFLLTTKLTYGAQLLVGARLPLSWDERERFEPSLACVFGITLLADGRSEDSRDGYATLGCGVELGF